MSSRSTPATSTASIASGATRPGSSFRIWRRAANTLLSTLFEPPCAACRQIIRHPLDGAVCDECWRLLRLAPVLHLRSESAQPVDWACAVDRYEGCMKEIIHALKYERRRTIAPRLGALMRERGAALLLDAEVVVPVPLHPRRQFQRGFNQADDLARQLGVPVVPLLKRVVFTRSQIELPAGERHQNVKDAFGLQPSALGRMPRIVVVVDDVSTTGATLDACARVLKEAGVKDVRALTAARVVHGPR